MHRRLAAVIARHPDRIALATILLVAALLRIGHIPQPLVDAFSWREASTAMMADNFRTGSWNIFYPEVSWTGPGPSYQGRELQLFSYLVALLHAAFGWHDWIGRLVAAIFGMVTVYALHRLVALCWDEDHAHAAALSYALLPGAVMVDTSFLPDSTMLALVTLGIWQIARYSQDGGRRHLVLGTAAFTAGALAKLPGAGAGLVILWLILAWLRRGDGAKVRAAGIAILAGLALLAAYYAWAIHLGRSYPPFHVAGSGYLWQDGLAQFIAQGFYGKKLWQVSVWWYLGYPVVLLCLIGLWSAPGAGAAPGKRDLIAVPHVWLIGGAVVYLAAAREIIHNPWNLHVLHVPLAAFCGRGMIVLITLGSAGDATAVRILRTTLLAVGILAISTIPLVATMKAPQAETARQMGQALEALTDPGDLVITVAPEVGDPIAIYYSRRRGWVFPPGGGLQVWSNFAETDADALAQLEEMQAQGAGWFALAWNAKDRMGRMFYDHHAGVLDHLNANAEMVSNTTDYVLFRLPQVAPAPQLR